MAAVTGERSSSDPLAGERFFVPPGSPAVSQVHEWSTIRPGDARLIEKIAETPTAYWLWSSPTVGGYVSLMLKEARRQRALPVFVTYFIPHRDCGSYSAGGAASPADYRQTVRQIATAIGTDRAVMIIEPDALMELGCGNPSWRSEQLSLLQYSVARFSELRNTTVYLDAGNRAFNPQWPALMASRLREAGIGHIRGFAVNVSNYGSVADEIAYGHQILAALHGVWHFVIDTSRDGRGWAPGYPWCNPPGMGLGPQPTIHTADRLVDAYLWIKLPGTSDGLCNGGPPAGVWWPEQALSLAENAVF